MKNTLTAFVLTLLIGFSSGTQAAFPDVPGSHPHSDAINYVKAQGIVAGNPDGTFKPDQNISRAAFTKIIVETYFSAAELQSCASGITSFSDVPSNAWFAPYVCVASNKNLIKGYPNGTFGPGNNINVAEAAKIISAHRKGERTGNPWFKPYLEDLGEVGAIPPQVNAIGQNVSRGLMAEMIHRLDAKLTNKSAKRFENNQFIARSTTTTTPAPAPVAKSDPAPVVQTEPEVMIKSEPVIVIPHTQTEIDAMTEEEKVAAEAELQAQIADVPDTIIEEAMPEPVTPEFVSETVKSGSFRDADRSHKGSGQVKIMTQEDGSHLLRFEGFSVTNGPDLYVSLVENGNPQKGKDVKAGYTNVAQLKGNQGSQNYVIPAGTDLSKYNSVVIYCQAYSVVFSVATLR